MSAKDETITTGLDRLNATFAWWGVPGASGNGQLDGQMKRFQASRPISRGPTEMHTKSRWAPYSVPTSGLRGRSRNFFAAGSRKT
jgi:hypothetical protein